MIKTKALLFLLVTVCCYGSVDAQTEGYRYIKDNSDFYIQVDDIDYIGSQADFFDQNGSLVSQKIVNANGFVQLDGLNPATVYTLKIDSSNEPDLEWLIMSPSESTGEINIHFNVEIADVTLDIDSDVDLDATSGLDLLNATIGYIDQAQDQIDVMMYNCSRPEFVNALQNAVNRGVKVRYITDNGTSNVSLSGPLNFNVLRGNDDGLMHNKVIIIDPNREDESWLFTGSTNFTTNQIGSDPNDFIAIQDQSLTRIYEIEFNEIWGGTSQIPNLNVSKFGSSKTNNTPKQIILSDGTLIEAYMSPSDDTADRIIDALDSAEISIDFGLLLFTHNGLSDAIVEADRRGIDIQGIINSDQFTGGEFDYLKNLGIDVILDPDNQKIFHHKYVILDHEDEEDGKICTGSHNWSFSADSRNDENMIVVHSQDVAEIYYAEFIAQRCLMNMADCVSSTNNLPSNEVKESFARYIGNRKIELKENHSFSQMEVFNLAGKQVSEQAIMSENFALEIPETNSGIYLVYLSGQDGGEVLKVYL